MASCSIIVAWRATWAGEPHGQESLAGYSPRGQTRYGHDWVTNTFTLSLSLRQIAQSKAAEYHYRFVSKRNDLFYIVYIVNVFWLFVFNLLSYVELFLPVKLFVVYIKFKKCILLLKNFLISLAPKVLQLLFSFALNFPIIFQILHLITFDSSWIYLGV